jgi:hypothetical protein
VLSTWQILKRESKTVQHVSVVLNGSEMETDAQFMVLKGAYEENGKVMETIWSDLVGSGEGYPSPGGVWKSANFQNINAVYVMRNPRCNWCIIRYRGTTNFYKNEDLGLCNQTFQCYMDTNIIQVIVFQSHH